MHMTFGKELFSSYTLLKEPTSISIASGVEIQAIAEGTVLLSVVIQGTKRTVSLTGVLYVLRLTENLISVL
jgi:hypothetical protein